MIEQPELWNGPHPSALPQTRPMVRRSDPGTSRDAAAMAVPNAAKLRDACLTLLHAAGDKGMTDHELAAALTRAGIACAGQTSCGKRRLELVQRGLVEQVYGADGEPLRRITPSGATALVWRAIS